MWNGMGGSIGQHSGLNIILENKKRWENLFRNCPRMGSDILPLFFFFFTGIMTIEMNVFNCRLQFVHFKYQFLDTFKKSKSKSIVRNPLKHSHVWQTFFYIVVCWSIRNVCYKCKTFRLPSHIRRWEREKKTKQDDMLR